MTDEELLDEARISLEYGYKRRDEHKAAADFQSSIAASLLVIARNSLPVNVESETPAQAMAKFSQASALPPSVDDGKDHGTGEPYVAPDN